MRRVIDFLFKNKYFKTATGLILSLLGCYLFFDTFIPVNEQKYLRNENDLTTITATLAEKPKYYEGKNKGLLLRLNGYTTTNFKNNAAFLAATNYQVFIADTDLGDTVTIKVDRKDFEKWYININSLSLFEQILLRPPNYFNFYSLRFKDKEYVGNIYNAAKEHDNNNLLFHAFFSVLLICIGIYVIIAKK